LDCPFLCGCLSLGFSFDAARSDWKSVAMKVLV
jgi:hypothetical protein